MTKDKIKLKVIKGECPDCILDEFGCECDLIFNKITGYDCERVFGPSYKDGVGSYYKNTKHFILVKNDF